ncbi:PREDICTED: uncharacterized protein LOC104709832 [Camelina sativa]|uniref:Uncharacterized protein LOC104709832 n=1 Tax=Camelina sativa TaxID=90675 RepID=A0ABM0TDE3_CAMSA|nr:PREDICTED: uncharacterized protein LOC104709832 [Camelina sativa]
MLLRYDWYVCFPQSNALYDAPGGSDHSPILVAPNDVQERRKVPFKFYTFFTTHPDYLAIVETAWNETISSSSKMFILCQKLKAVKIGCKALNRTHFSNIQARTAEAKELLATIQNQILSAPNSILFEEERLARQRWLILSTAEETFLREKSRVRWCSEGDSNTRFFHNSVKAHQARNLIRSLLDSDGERVTDSSTLKVMIVEYYKQLLGTKNTQVKPLTVQQIRELHPFRCTEDLASSLIAIPSTELITTTLFSLPRSKTPGPDGFTVDFFINSWGVVGPSVIDAVSEFFKMGKLLKQVNATILALIPKTVTAESLTEFRPISCCNTIYKVISRILAGRFKLFTAEAVQRNQVAFIPGRLLCENVLLAMELVTDFNKEGEKGLRQGDSISGPLFTLVMDILSKQLDNAATDNRFQTHPQCGSPLITHLSFADDILVFFDGTESSLDAILDILTQFKSVSGNAESARGAKVSWETVCSPKSIGGLGLRRLIDWNKIFGLKLIWLLYSEAGSLWVSWIKSHLIRDKIFWEADFRSSGSCIWKGLLKLRPLARPYVGCNILSGRQALFWHDNWTGLGSLLDIVGDQGPRVTGISYQARVIDASSNGGWILPRSLHPLVHLLRVCLQAQVPPFQEADDDTFHWKIDADQNHAKFSSIKTWRHQHPTGNPVTWHTQIWFKERIPRMAFMAWLTVQDRLTTRDRLIRWSLPVPPDCLLCQSAKRFYGLAVRTLDSESSNPSSILGRTFSFLLPLPPPRLFSPAISE